MNSSTIDAAHLVRMLGAWTSTGEPLNKSLALSLRTIIRRGELTPMTRMPSERELARALTVSRTTVVSAYDELRATGMLTSQRGSGTWVNLSHRSSRGMADQVALFPWVHRLATIGLEEGHKDVVDFSAVAVSGEGPVTDVLRSISQSDWVRLTATGSYFPLGIGFLRGAVARDYQRLGLPTSPEQILITTGAQQGADLITTMSVQPSDTVAVENPTYAGVLPIFRRAGARVLPVSMDENGIRVDELERLAESQDIRLIYLNPTFQNPTGTVLSETRRRRIAALADATGTIVMESLVSADISFDMPVPPPVAAFGSGCNNLTLGSMSTLFWSGLRIGWVRGPEHLISRLGRLKATADLGTSFIDQLVATRLLERVTEVKRIRCSELAVRRNLLAEHLNRLLPDWSWRRARGGTCLWVKLPRGDTGELSQVALRHGVLILPGTLFSPNGEWQSWLRLPFVLEARRLKIGIERLAKAWDEYASSLERAEGG